MKKLEAQSFVATMVVGMTASGKPDQRAPLLWLSCPSDEGVLPQKAPVRRRARRRAGGEEKLGPGEMGLDSGKMSGGM